jgi:hypothetical protein
MSCPEDYGKMRRLWKDDTGRGGGSYVQKRAHSCCFSRFLGYAREEQPLKWDQGIWEFPFEMNIVKVITN